MFNSPYLTELTWFVQKKEPDVLKLESLKEFNDDYTYRKNTVNFEKRLRDLLKAGILEKNSFGEYRFKYPYIYFYLKGKYLSENLEKDEIFSYVQDCCKHLYVRSKANTILFLAHHSRSEKFIEILEETLVSTLSKITSVKFNGDTVHISEFIKDSNELYLDIKRCLPRENRQEINEHLDSIDIYSDNDDEAQELDELDFVAEINVLFKTTEIIGQILKNQYSSLGRLEKVNLLTEIIEGMMRGLQAFYSHLISDPTAIINELTSAFQKQSVEEDPVKIRRFAERFVGQLLKALSVGMFVKTITSINSKKLQEFIQSIDSDEDNAKELIKVGSLLDSFGRIPYEELQALLKKIEKENVATSILYFLIQRRVYLFPVREIDIQKLESIFKLDSSKLKGINYLTGAKQRLIN